MPYLSKDLSVLAYANGHTSWHYVTTDPLPEVTSDGYFQEANSMFRVGDQFTIQLNTSDTTAELALAVVRSMSPDVVIHVFAHS